MNLVNATRMTAGFTLGMRPDASESIVVVVKGTFTLPQDGGQPSLHPKQEPLVDADVFSGEPGFSAPIYESDYALFKPRCDVLLNGSAYAPGGKPAQQVPVALHVGPVTKSFNVVGHRVWKQGAVSIVPTTPQYFVRMPISYDNAYGGVDKSKGDPEKFHYYAANHAGVGYHHDLSLDHIVDQPVPNTEELNDPVRNPRGKYRPMAFGPVGRSWDPRPALAGTYDQHWKDNVFPFLPADFKDDYYQSAPPDQQMPCPRGGEPVALMNLTPDGQRKFRLPGIEVPVEFTNAAYERTEVTAVIDTIIIEPDDGRFMMVWRASHPLKRNMLEIRQIVVGRMPKGWYRARALGKTYLPSLVALGPEGD